MVTPEEAMCTVMGFGMDPSKILEWTTDPVTNQLLLMYDGPEPLTAINMTILVLNANPVE